MVSAKRCFAVLSLIVSFLLSINVFGYVIDDEVPDVTGRVARISFLSGDARVRRNGGTDWEVAAQNLPLVEGDEITTASGARVEIQFDVRTFVRLEENSVLRITTFQDQGVALSLPEGTASIRVTDFDHDRSYLEVDIPNSTVAIQKSGIYRIDVGDKNSTEARIRATDGGEARVYSDTSGFTLKNGRVATVYLSGQSSGEWNLADASVFADEFDKWALDRDAVTAKRIKDAFFDKYYDRDMAGAEDLSDYGDWVFTKKYGYVWRPYANAVGMYADWSPYRYGHWRWIPPYGWTWVNDEPWGWATYHYGRWVWDNGYWYWTPYGYYRYRRSWWQPALVVINIINNNVCWYPLPYNHRYYNYSRNYGGGNWGGRRDNDRGGRRDDDRGGRGDRPGVGPTPTPAVVTSPGGKTSAELIEERRKRMHTPPMQRDVPASGVVTMSVDDFGRGRRGAQRPSTEIAKTVLSRDPDETTAVVLPSIDKVEPRISREIKTEAPRIVAEQRQTRIGAAERKTEQPLDQELRRTRILGDRTPVRIEQKPPISDSTTVPTVPAETRETRRRTGAVDRPQIPTKSEVPEATSQPTFKPSAPVETKRERPQRDLPAYETNKVEQPKRESVERTERPKFEPPVRSDSPPREQPRSEVPTRREEPRYQPPPQRETPRVEAPRREEPRSEPSRRQESPPPSKSEPKVDKPSPSSSKSGGKKDGGE
jgi:hypothetical protein